MAYTTILYEKKNKTACITLNRPDRLNAINDVMMNELDQAYREAESDQEVWTIIVTGNGRGLCSGADVSNQMIKEKPDDGRVIGVPTRGEPVLGTIRQWDAPQEATAPYLQMTKPFICAVNGIAAGAGLDLVTTSDIVIASDQATFFDPHVSIGIVSGREVVRLARVLPLNITMRLALMGKHERLSAQRAYELGLVSEVVPHDKLMERAWAIADTVNLNAPLAVRGTRLAIRKGLSLPIYEAEVLAESYRLRVAHTEDAKEGPRSFAEKRAPKWQVK
jgi:enoyl-CoA hydratase/carnithine racemase